jgi:FdhD protein
MAGPVGCGLCGIESIDQAMRAVPAVAPSPLRMTPAQVLRAVASLTDRQPLHDYTRAAHCAAYWTSDGIVAAREDVGRHNALDKLAGHVIRAGYPQGAVVLTSRVSIDMVQKVAALGAPILIAVSAPTAHAVELADEAGITLIALARSDRFEVFSHSDRLTEVSHVR